jgi:hypothetical protein
MRHNNFSTAGGNTARLKQVTRVNIRKTLILLATALAISACESEAPADEAAVDKVSKGAELLKPFKMELQQALKTGMSQGPEHAIDVCRVKAPEIAAALSQQGIRMGRASHKLRNPGNEGPEWVQPILADYLETEQREPVEVALENGYIGYAEPIGIQPLCLTCHGETIAPGVAATIAEAYPEDQATGFENGDLRGVFWVEFPTHK